MLVEYNFLRCNTKNIFFNLEVFISSRTILNLRAQCSNLVRAPCAKKVNYFGMSQQDFNYLGNLYFFVRRFDLEWREFSLRFKALFRRLKMLK